MPGEINSLEQEQLEQDFNSTRNANGTIPSIFFITEHSRNCVIVYCILFFIASVGNLSVLVSVYKKSRRLKWRITILILHLVVADLIVTFFIMPMEIFWRISVQWLGGNMLCKICQFFRGFGLYLSSMIVICISIDRFIAIYFPLKMANASKRVKMMLVLAWMAAVVCSAPQLFVFSLQQHPKYEFRQCVSFGFFSNDTNEMLYNVFSLSALYFVPLIVIIVTYGMISWKIFRKSIEHKQSRDGRENLFHLDGSSKINLRRNEHGELISRAKNRTLRLTLIIVLVFFLCWTPYTIMTLWYMFDRESAKKINQGIQEIFFLMAVANSCANPLIYGNYTKDKGGFKFKFCSKKWGSPTDNIRTDRLPITSVI